MRYENQRSFNAGSHQFLVEGERLGVLDQAGRLRGRDEASHSQAKLTSKRKENMLGSSLDFSAVGRVAGPGRQSPMRSQVRVHKIAMASDSDPYLANPSDYTGRVAEFDRAPDAVTAQGLCQIKSQGAAAFEEAQNLALNADIGASLLTGAALRQIFTKTAGGSDSKRKRNERVAVSTPDLQLGESAELKTCTAEARGPTDLAPGSHGRPGGAGLSARNSNRFRFSNSFMTAATRKKMGPIK